MGNKRKKGWNNGPPGTQTQSSHSHSSQVVSHGKGIAKNAKNVAKTAINSSSQINLVASVIKPTSSSKKAKNKKGKRLFKKKKDLYAKINAEQQESEGANANTANGNTESTDTSNPHTGSFTMFPSTSSKFIYQKSDSFTSSGAIEASGKLSEGFLDKIQGKRLVVVGDGNLGWAASVAEEIGMSNGKCGSNGKSVGNKNHSFGVLATVLESRNEFYEQFGDCGRQNVQRIEQKRNHSDINLKFGINATNETLVKAITEGKGMVSAGSCGNGSSIKSSIKSSINSSINGSDNQHLNQGIILAWHFPYTVGLSWGNDHVGAQHNDGWAISTLPQFFRNACVVWERLNRDKPFIVSNKNGDGDEEEGEEGGDVNKQGVKDEIPVEIWLTLREVHYRQWRLQSGKLTRRPESKLKVMVNNMNNEDGRGKKTQRTLGLELIDRRHFGKEDWKYYGNGAFGDSRDRVVGDVRERDRVTKKGLGNIPVYQDDKSSTYIWRVVVEEEKRVF